MQEYDIALYETDRALKKQSYAELLTMVKDSEVLPVEIEAGNVECSAIGFINYKAAAKLDFDYTGLNKHISEILDDLEKENDQHLYTYKGLSIYMDYERSYEKDRSDDEGNDISL